MESRIASTSNPAMRRVVFTEKVFDHEYSGLVEVMRHLDGTVSLYLVRARSSDGHTALREAAGVRLSAETWDHLQTVPATMENENV
jgi:hypothetical protein